ncbi:MULTISPECIES: RCC1 domain-containing protein [Pseudomonas syringae group]|uniref:RCC1 domain-containing protein n=1 Tax=Pseudomonas syringae group TaxID=136849 RepID=UPI0012B7C8CD|nr:MULTISPECIES: RCC1 domain-containing protein [Pseudomonas syringae group]
MTRKIVQISAVSSGGGYHPAVVALADDGSVWAAGFNPEAMKFDQWEPLPVLAVTDEEQLRLVKDQKSKEAEQTLGFWKRMAVRFFGC